MRASGGPQLDLVVDVERQPAASVLAMRDRPTALTATG